MQFTQGKFLLHQIEDDGFLLDFFLEGTQAGIQDLPVIERHIPNLPDRMPMQLIVQQFQLMITDIDQGKIGRGNDATCRMSAQMTKGLDLLQEYVLQTCTVAQDTIRSRVQVLIRAQQVPEQ